jgi:hypothetical protein
LSGRLFEKINTELIFFTKYEITNKYPKKKEKKKKEKKKKRTLQLSE